MQRESRPLPWKPQVPFTAGGRGKVTVTGEKKKPGFESQLSHGLGKAGHGASPQSSSLSVEVGVDPTHLAGLL